MKPSIGRIVHYRALGSADGKFPVGECRAAIVTSIDKDSVDDPLDRQTVSLCILNPTGMYFNQEVVKGDEASQWHWPERVE